MKVRDKINQLVDEYKESLILVVDGNATPVQKERTLKILDRISFHTTRLFMSDNNEGQGKGMENDDLEHLQKALKATRQELVETKLVLATLITWLQKEIGRENATILINDLNKETGGSA